MTDKTKESLSIQTRRERGALVVTLTGRLSATAGVTLLKETLGPLIDSGTNRFVLDLSGVPYADSMGIEALVSVYQRTSARGGGMRILNPSPKVRQLFELTRLSEVLGVTDDETGAIDAVLGNG